MTEKTAVEELKDIEEKRKELKQKIVSDKIEKKEKESLMREAREETLDARREILDHILFKIYNYNKLGKADRLKINIFREIIDTLNKLEKENEKK